MLVGPSPNPIVACRGFPIGALGLIQIQALAASRSKQFNRRLEVIGRFALEQNTFGGSGMHEPERPRMKHRTHRFDLRAGVIADVHAFADQRMAELGQVDSNLMLASGLEAAFDQRGTHKAGDRPDVRNRTFPLDQSVALRMSEMSMRAP